MRRLLQLTALLGRLSANIAAQQSVPVADQAQIRAARAEYNRAISAHDTLAMSRFWLPEYVGVSSTNAVTVGLDAMRSRFADIIKSRPDVIFVRTPDRIVVNKSWGQAAEHGTWTGRWNQSGSITRVTGQYFAKWVKRDGRWLLLSETFVQTTCAGSSYCNQP